MSQLKKRIIRLFETGEIGDKVERDNLLSIVTNKRFNPYCIRHSSISSDSDHLPEYALKKKVRWSMNSKQGSRYIKSRWINELKNKILEYNGIIASESIEKKPSILNCPRCSIVNAYENMYCISCSYPLKPMALDLIKEEENKKVQDLENKYNEMNNILQSLLKSFSSIDESGNIL